MAVAITSVAGADFSGLGNKRCRVRTLTFSGTYPVGGETVTAASIGLRKIEQALFHQPVAAGSTPANAEPLGCVYATDGQSVTIRTYQLGGTGVAGDPLIEKTAEAYITGLNTRVTFIGY